MLWLMSLSAEERNEITRSERKGEIGQQTETSSQQITN